VRESCLTPPTLLEIAMFQQLGLRGVPSSSKTVRTNGLQPIAGGCRKLGAI